MTRWVRFVHRHHVAVLLLALVVWAGAGAVVLNGATLSNGNTFTFEAGQAQDLIAAQIAPAAASGNTLGLTYTNPGLPATSPAFRAAVTAALAPARRDARVLTAVTPWSGAPGGARISSDNHSVLVTLTLRTADFTTAESEANAIYAETAPPWGYTEASFGTLAVQAEINSYVSRDLKAGSGISVVAALVLLLVIFGTVVAALCCVGVGGVAVTLGLAITFLLNRITDVSPYATDVVGLIGLGVGIDYSLFITSRFREELDRGESIEQALVTAYSTAGRAICFSGFIVAVGLSGMVFFHGTFLVSMGLAGTAVVAATVLTALTLLVALLSLLGHRVNAWRLPVVGRPRHSGEGMWHAIAEFVMRHPVAVLIPALAVLLIAASPLPNLTLANSDYETLPTSAPARIGSELLASRFPEENETTIDVVVDFARGGPYTDAAISGSSQLAARLQRIPGVLAVDSYVTDVAGATSATYEHLYGASTTTVSLPPAIASTIETLNGSSIAVLEVDSHLNENGSTAENLVRTIRTEDAVPGATVYVGGDTAFNIDFLAFIEGHTAPAIIYVMIVTFLVLLLLLRSVVLPLKAVLMNLLSLGAAYGAMVWIFQQGHLGGLLNVTAQPIDSTLPPLLFCIVFGLSMDYEVFLMTRMQEIWHSTHDNRRAVSEGLEACGRLVTGAAAIMIAVFAAFAFGHVVVIKAIGVGMAVAVIADATLVRALVVPALMRLLGRANWWAPAWLSRRPAQPGTVAQRPAGSPIQ